ncbi:MAG: hypothetical protein U5K54_00205 [Cytophagales bacterium]|nr:hypothetical protein [Cytophagales bacterium]
MQKSLLFILIIGFSSWMCTPKNTESNTTEEVVVAESKDAETVNLILDEHHINEIAITNHPSATPRVAKKDKKVSKLVAAPEMPLEEPYQSIPASVLVESLTTNEELIPIEGVSSVIIPLEETQTIQSLNEKGKNTGGVQIVSNTLTGEIDHIIFQDKNHTDYYDVKVGMSAKEIRKLRREMKHIVHKGKVFYYSDDSNIMYVLDIQYEDGQELTEFALEESFVSAIVWKDKAHKEHPKRAS